MTGSIRVMSFRNGGSAIILEVRVGGTQGPIRDLTLPIGRPSHIAVEKLLGRDLSQWGEAIIEVYPNGKFVNVYDEEYQSQRSESSGRSNVGRDNIPF